MLCALIVALALSAGSQNRAADRTRAQDLARAGRNVEAIAVFKQILEADPADIDSRVALASVLTRTGAWREALAILKETEIAAGENADLFAALARAYRRAGDDRQAIEYFERARVLSPLDPDVVFGYEAVARAYGHGVALEGFGQDGPAGTVGAGAMTFDLRVAPRLHLAGTVRKQDGPDYSDLVGGGGAFVRVANNTTAALNIVGAPTTTALPELNVAADVVHYAGVAEIGVSVRRLDFAGSELIAISPLSAWNSERWRLDARYTLSRSKFDTTGESTTDHSVLLRATRQQWRRIALLGSYAYGIESFETLTADRIGALGTTTLAPGIRIDLRSLTRINTVWEHQWRSDDTVTDRLTVTLIQVIP